MELVKAAKAARQNAYAPYSGFRVGAALAVADGRIFSGCNVENASYGLGICAERMAVGAAVAAGYTDITRIVVVTDSPEGSAPCGACRQFLAEFGAGMEVEAIGPDGSRRWTLGELLPDRFSGKDLNI